MLEIRYDKDKIKRLERELRGFPKNSLPKVMSRGLNLTATNARTQVVKAIADKKRIKASGIRKFIFIRRATYKNWRSTLNFTEGEFPIIDLDPRKTSAGVTYKHPFRQKRTLIKHAFIAKMESRHRGVYIRATEHVKIGYWIGMREWWARKKYRTIKKEAINELKGPSTEELFTSRLKGKIDRIRVESKQRLAKNIHDQVRLILKRRLPA